MRLLRKVRRFYKNKEIIEYEQADSFCNENGTSFALVALQEVDAYAVSDSLPLIKMTDKWTQTVYCLVDDNNSTTNLATVSFSYNGESSSIGSREC